MINFLTGKMNFPAKKRFSLKEQDELASQPSLKNSGATNTNHIYSLTSTTSAPLSLIVLKTISMTSTLSICFSALNTERNFITDNHLLFLMKSSGTQKRDSQ